MEEDEDEEMQVVTVSLSAAQQISIDSAVVADLSQLDGISQ